MIVLTSANSLNPCLVNPSHIRYGLVDGDGYTVLHLTPGPEPPVALRVTETPVLIQGLVRSAALREQW